MPGGELVQCTNDRLGGTHLVNNVEEEKSIKFRKLCWL